jgi:hypothetical protein
VTDEDEDEAQRQRDDEQRTGGGERRWYQNDAGVAKKTECVVVTRDWEMEVNPGVRTGKPCWRQVEVGRCGRTVWSGGSEGLRGPDRGTRGSSPPGGGFEEDSHGIERVWHRQSSQGGLSGRWKRGRQHYDVNKGKS